MSAQDERLIEPCNRHDRELWLRMVSYGISFLTAILVTVLCLNVQARASAREATQREQLQQEANRSHEALCAVIASLDDNASAVPASTNLGRTNARTYAMLRVSQNCPPRTEN